MSELMYFKQDGAISKLNVKPRKLLDQFTYHGTNISSIDSNVSICIEKAWSVIDRLSIIWKSEARILSNFRHISTIVWLHYLDSNKTLREKARWELHKDAACCFEQVLDAAPYKTTPVPPLTSHLSNYLNHCKRSRNGRISDILLWIPTHGRPSVNQLAKTFISSVWTLDSI